MKMENPYFHTQESSSGQSFRLWTQSEQVDSLTLTSWSPKFDIVGAVTQSSQLFVARWDDQWSRVWSLRVSDLILVMTWRPDGSLA